MTDYHQGSLVVTRPPHYPTMHTRETVTHLAAFGLDENQVAVVLKCTPEDVRTYYSGEMEHGLMRVNAQVQNAVLHAALYEADMQAAKMWLVNKAGWKAGDARAVAIAGGGVGDGDVIVERRQVIERILTRVARDKRKEEQVIEGRVVKANGNGAKAKTNGNGSGGNGAKHK